jgi:hypothetical protein
MVPLMERLGVTTAAEVDSATLAERLLAEIAACDGSGHRPPDDRSLGHPASA